MPAVLFGAALVVVAVLLARGFLSLEPRELARILRWTGAAAAVVATLLLILSGREGVLVPLALVALPLALRRSGRRWLGGARAGSPAPGRSSCLETRLLRMTLEHDSGRLSGEVRAGRFAGRRLDQLGDEDLTDLRQDCRRDDPEGLPVLETWLERSWGPGWRQRAEAAGGPGAAAQAGPMTRDEALSVLGLEAGAGSEAVREAHRRLMARVHPDHGGSTWLAAKLNQARDLLLKS
ncbi:MAG: hypothetical protein WCO00_04310 [Rhodospirillaceae bacterium]